MMNQRAMRAVARKAIFDAALSGNIFVSPVSGWEIGLLSLQNGPFAVTFQPDVATWIARLMDGPGIRLAPFNFDIAVGSSYLPGDLHNDPADRFLIATARYLDVPLVTSDRQILRYGNAGHVQVVRC